MAQLDKLYPPMVAGVIPSFWGTDGSIWLSVPFSMNKMVGVESHGGLVVRVKSTTSDQILCIVDQTGLLETVDAKSHSYIAKFNLSKYSNLFNVGAFYRIQLAYRSQANTGKGIIGYYSDVAIAKYTNYPTVKILGLTDAETNYNRNTYIGTYTNTADLTEKVHQYKFSLTDVYGNEVETSGWQYHNADNDDAQGYQTDTYTVKRAIEKADQFYVQYSIITNNQLQVSSPSYQLSADAAIELDLQANLIARNDYENGYINLTLEPLPAEEGKEPVFPILTGKYILSRAEVTDGYSVWTTVFDFELIGASINDFFYRDYAVESGVSYVYAIQQYNDSGVQSARQRSNPIVSQFEDMFLYDGTRQLKVRFNANVSSFKTVKLESKKTTLGSKYPFFFENGVVGYKEFPIQGMISYNMDEAQTFLNRADVGFGDFVATTNQTDENYGLERIFKLAVLDWLNDGKIKLFKSAQEGNYLVKISGVSLAPVNGLGRMLHTFSCTATEAQEYTVSNLQNLNMLTTTVTADKKMIITTTSLADYVQEATDLYNYYNEQIHGQGVSLTERLQYISDYGDIVNGIQCTYIKFEGMKPGTIVRYQDSTCVDENDYREFMIGVTGAYEAFFQTGATKIHLPKIDATLQYNYGMQGSLTYGYMSSSWNVFDLITSLDTFSIPVYAITGPEENVLRHYNDKTKFEIAKIYNVKFRRQNLEKIIPNVVLGNNEYNNTATPFQMSDFIALHRNKPDPHILYYETEEEGSITEEDGTVVVNKHRDYYLYEGGKLRPIDIDTVAAYTGRGTHVYSSGSIMEKNMCDAWAAGQWNNMYNIYTIYYTESSKGIKTYYRFDGEILQQLDNQDKGFDTSVQWGPDLTIDVGDSGEFELNNITDIPDYINIGNGVYAEFAIQVRVYHYTVEQDSGTAYSRLTIQRMAFENAYQKYCANRLGFKQIPYEKLDDASLEYQPQKCLDYTRFFIMENYQFKAIDRQDAFNLVGHNIHIFAPLMIDKYHNGKEDVMYDSHHPYGIYSPTEIEAAKRAFENNLAIYLASLNEELERAGRDSAEESEGE